MHGDRLSATQPIDKLFLAAGLVILSPYLPLLFMGEEYGEKAPFPYFVSYADPSLIEAVRKGRRAEFSSFAWEGEAMDPQDETAFLRAKIDLTMSREGEQALIYKFYRLLLTLRKDIPSFRIFTRKDIVVTGTEEQKILVILRHTEQSAVLCLYSLSDQGEDVAVTFPAGEWKKILDSSAAEWGGPGEAAVRTVAAASETESRIRLNPFSLVVYYSNG
jgi:maltooligosyltrehalose trehalohydrolase